MSCRSPSPALPSINPVPLLHTFTHLENGKERQYRHSKRYTFGVEGGECRKEDFGWWFAKLCGTFQIVSDIRAKLIEASGYFTMPTQPAGL